MCANRLTFPMLLRDFSVENFLRWVYGLFLKIFLLTLRKTNVQFYHTGSQVAHAFSLPRSSRYLIDVNLTDAKYQKQSVSQHRNNYKRIAFFGRLNKLQIAHLEMVKSLYPESTVHLFGPVEPHFQHEGVSYNGFISPADVLHKMQEYDAVLATSDEYYEGFPRTIAQAILLELPLIVNTSAVFYKDVAWYSYLQKIDTGPNVISSVSEIGSKEDVINASILRL